ncbi:MAG: Gfo/Idh/MocA family oxidoreductase [Proteobacteria bacterium]|nr:Gfo/Idh/MocA family oxidoreductase [Pseudomonadota bacterium]MBU1140236.1 Gfo/Idh/MocA family oxidoreductase [Pseudomonadota bacterium]MBU1234132.1 Gfo/Idh/MocA family oxidoreductase [Pseudomonadota bacterium]MBU1419281.1 Gfo/Idh/MocA family oxidoreductase [Pseudomonadota bacterium]MBU1453224.1 Gfo/Idh/MocA family oxidoreductase [Pseudomonadota bacterium]
MKVGVIGVGYLGKFHAQKYAAIEGVELVGVADVDTVAAESVAKANNCAAFSDYRQLLKEVDAVSVVVPTSQHHAVALDCIEAGVDMLMEKPITTTLEEADDIIGRAAERGLILQVGHLERFNPAVQAMEPSLTTPIFIESQRISTFKSRGVDVDVVLDLMIHDIDIILNIIKSPLQTIHTVGAPVVTDFTDIANARLIFENGATANVTVSRISRTNSRRMRIFQPGALIHVDFANRKVMTVNLKKGEFQENGMPKQDVVVRSFPEGDALNSEIMHFVENVRNRTRPLVSGDEGRRALDVALQVMKQIGEHLKLGVYAEMMSAEK